MTHPPHGVVKASELSVGQMIDLDGEPTMVMRVRRVYSARPKRLRKVLLDLPGGDLLELEPEERVIVVGEAS